MSRAVDMAREASETNGLWKECGEGQGSEQSSRESKVSVGNSHAVERMPTNDAVMSRAVDKRRVGISRTVGEGLGNEQSSRESKVSRNSRAVERMLTRDRVMSKAETAREALGTHVL
jgi:hypothetical protein